MLKVVTMAAAVLVLAACSRNSGSDAGGEQANMRAAEVADSGKPGPPEVSPLVPEDLRRVCRAAIADLNGQDPSITKVVSEDAGTIRIRYTRPSDGKVWTNDCRIEGDRIVWRTVNAFGAGSGEGRWRSDPADEVLTYRAQGDRVTITTTFSGEEPASETYTVTD